MLSDVSVIQELLKKIFQKIGSELLKEREELYSNTLSMVETASEDLEKLFFDASAFVDPCEGSAFLQSHQKVLDLEKQLKTRKYRSLPNNKKLDREFSRLKASATSLGKRIHDHNEKAAEQRCDRVASVIGKVEGRALDRQQLICIAKEVKNHLVIAGAGTGKTTTIVGKIKYLLLTEQYSPEDILVLSFTNASAAEISARIKAETGSKVDAMTFHKLGMNIIASAEKKQPKVSQMDMGAFVSKAIFRRTPESPSFRHYLSVYTDLKCEESEQRAKKPKEAYEEYLRSNPPKTFKGETVKSYGEVEIANFLAVNGIEYDYERPYEIDTRTEEYGLYKPDFYLPKYQIYIEYFGIDIEGNVPEYFSKGNSQSAAIRYNDSIAWKRELHRKNKTKLIECFYYEKRDGTLTDNLEAKLNEQGVEFSPVSEEKLAKGFLLSEETHSYFSDLFTTLINLIKSCGITVGELKRKAAVKGLSKLYGRILDLLSPIFSAYNNALHEREEIDFNDMIIEASRLVREGKYLNRYKLVIVDEYQDISKARFGLLKALRDSGFYSLFCVGDDWQSIYRFSGSDISYIFDFSAFWGPSEISRIETTYRFSKSLIDISGRFIMENPLQIKKELRANSFDEGIALEFVDAYSQNSACFMLADVLRRLPSGKSVFLIGRYRFDRGLLENGVFSIRYDNSTGKTKVVFDERPDLDISFITAHGSKGLQADYVVIINNREDRHGFPSGVSNSPLIDLLLETDDKYPFAEERRLYYVALTRAREKVFLLLTSLNVSEFAREINKMMPNSIEFPQHICPMCGGDLVIRSGQYGQFLGCSNYFSKGCRYKAKLNTVYTAEENY